MPTEDAYAIGARVRAVFTVVGTGDFITVSGEVDELHTAFSGRMRPGVTLRVEPASWPAADRLATLGELAAEQGEGWAQRRHQRVPIRLTALVKYGARQIPARLSDLSEGGAQLNIDGELPSVHDEVEIVVELQEMRASLRLTAEVRWRNPLSGRRGIGVSFTGGEIGWHRRLSRLVRELRQG